jgi:hypothetical protein
MREICLLCCNFKSPFYISKICIFNPPNISIMKSLPIFLFLTLLVLNLSGQTNFQGGISNHTESTIRNSPYADTVLHAQSPKNYLARATFGYHYSHQDASDAINPYSGSHYYGQKNSGLTLTLDAGRKLKSHYYYGLAFSFANNREEINPEGDVPSSTSGSSGYISTTYSGNYHSNSNVFSPSLYFQYYTFVLDRVCLSLDAYTRFDIDRTKVTTHSRGTFIIINDSLVTNENESKKVSEKQFINLGISPSFRFRLAKNLGLEWRIGTLEFRQKLLDSLSGTVPAKSHEFNIGLKPENWQMGFWIEL